MTEFDPVCRRCARLAQFLAEGRERFELLVGAAVLANNLMVIAGLLLKRHERHRAAA